jgi:putative methionine-R-sulfoxide reductase with GAF domain
MSRFDYVKYDETHQKNQEKLKKLYTEVAETIESMTAVHGRAQALALTKLEESYMWTGKMLRDHQIMRNGGAELQEQRMNS